MKKCLYILFFLLFQVVAFAQINYNRVTIDIPSVGNIESAAYLDNGRLMVVDDGFLYELQYDDQTFKIDFLKKWDTVEVHSVMPIDYNQDGSMDLLGWNTFFEKLYLYERSGDNMVFKGNILNGVESISTFDVDNDGDDELLVNGSMYKWQNGTLTQLFRCFGSSGYQFKNPVAKDYDKDGDIDIIYNLVTNLGVFWTREDSTYLPKNISNFSHRVDWLRDVNFNGEVQAIANIDGQIKAIDYDTLTKEWTEVALTESFPNNGNTTVLVADVNQDTYDDIILYINSLGRVTTLIYDPIAEKYTQTDQQILLSNHFIFTVEDGPNDVELNFFRGNQIHSYRYSEDFILEKIGQTANQFMDLYRNSFVDINGDGYIDHVNHKGQKRLYDGEGSFSDISDYMIPGPNGRYEDVDNDGDVDYILDSLLYINIGDGQFGNPIPNPAYNPYPEPEIFFVNVIHESDLDQDGDIDLLAYNRFGESLFLFTNDNNESFDSGRELATSTHISGTLRYINTIDMDLDGHLDILMSAASGLIWIKHNGNLDFEPPTALYNEQYSPRSLSVRDGNKDGFVDILLGTGDIFQGKASGNVLLYTGSTDGPNLTYTSPYFDNYMSNVEFIDADSIGVDDILYANGLINIVPVEDYSNIIFDPIDIAEHTNDLMIKDVNNDGRDDIITYTDGSPNFVYWEYSKAKNNNDCPAGNVILRSQGEVDEFGRDFARCEIIDGNLHIGSTINDWSDIEDLSPLFGIKAVNGNMKFNYVNGVKDFSFDSLKVVKGELQYNLLKFSNGIGMKSLESIGGINMLNAFGNLSFYSLSNLKENTGDIILAFGSYADISPLLVNDSIFGDLVVDDRFNAFSNPVDIRAIQNIKYIEGDLKIGGIRSEFIFDEGTFANLIQTKSFDVIVDNNNKKIQLSILNDSLTNFRTNLPLDFSTNTISYIDNDLELSSGKEIGSWASLTHVGNDLLIDCTEELLDPFGGLKYVGGNLNVGGDCFRDLTQFETLDHLGALRIHKNNIIKNLIGVDKIDTLNSLTLFSCTKLKNLEGLNQELVVEKHVQIYKNSNLTFCDYDWLCQHLKRGSNLDVIRENGIGCEGEYRLRCLNNSVSGFTYYDFNGDGLFQPNTDGLLSNMKIAFALDDTLITSKNGFYQRFVLQGDKVNIMCDFDDKFKPTTSPAIQIDSFYPGILTSDDYNFGFQLKEGMNTPNVMTEYSTSLYVCDRKFYLFGLMSNISSTVLDGYIEVIYDDGLSLDTSYTQYTALDTVSRAIIMDINDIYPYQNSTLKIPFVAPSAEFLNEEQNIVIKVHHIAENGLDEVIDEYIVNLDLLCSYDPNDKLVKTPDEEGNLRVGEDNQLIYTIRFQNTGNYYAEDVRIEDVIDENLDISSFEFIDASHDVEIKIVDRKIIFLFEDIFLIDSTSNFEESQGFVTFSIQIGTSDLGQSFHNDAEIYFDFNEPIITNEVTSTIYDPSSTNEIYGKTLHIFPVPAGDVLHIQDTYGFHNVAIRDILGHKLLSSTLSTDASMDISMLTTGFYIIELYNEDSGRAVFAKFYKQE